MIVLNSAAIAIRLAGTSPTAAERNRHREDAAKLIARGVGTAELVDVNAALRALQSGRLKPRRARPTKRSIARTFARWWRLNERYQALRWCAEMAPRYDLPMVDVWGTLEREFGLCERQLRAILNRKTG